MTYTELIERRRRLRARAAAVLLAAAIAAGWIYQTRGDEHSCKAPCTVEFGQGMEEDEFAVDYRAGELRVWRAPVERETAEDLR